MKVKRRITVKELKRLLNNYEDLQEVKFYTDENQLGERYIEIEVDDEVIFSTPVEN